MGACVSNVPSMADMDGRTAAQIAAVQAELRAQRARTLALIAPLDATQLSTQHSPLQSPIVWDLGHIANFEERWAVDAVEVPATRRVRLDRLYDPEANPRRVRGTLGLPTPAEACRYLETVRARTEVGLARARFDGGDPLVAAAYVYAMVAQHEAQHGETMLQTVQLIADLVYEPEWRRDPPNAEIGPTADMIAVPAGPFLMGTDDRAVAYDNERPAHVVELAAYDIDATPVTNARYLAFVDDGGYRRRELWTADGWVWLEQAGVRHPGHWVAVAPGRFRERYFGRTTDLLPARPVVHVSWYEASAYARWAGKRLPTEAEWEKAAAWDPAARRPRRYPWGDAPPGLRYANLDQRTFAPAPVGSYPLGASPSGCLQMIGDVWEWTASDFAPYPGFAPFPYPEYSAAHFGNGYKVLRGGSWATRPVAVRNTFRNWDLPERRQIFAGFRCATDR